MMRKVKPILALLILSAFALIHGTGLKNFVWCIEQTGDINLEFSADGDCCGHNEEHKVELPFDDSCEPGHEDLLFGESTSIQKISRSNITLNNCSLVVYVLPPWPLQLVLIENNIIDADLVNCTPNSLLHHSSTILLI